MTTYIEQAQAALLANPQLVALLTGGIHLFPDSGRKGLTRLQLVQAFSTTTGLIQPVCIMYQTKTSFTGEAVSMERKFQSTKTPISMWIYDDGDAGYDAIDAANDLIYSTLYGFRLTNGYQILWGDTIKYKREPLLEDACYYQFVCYAYGHT